MERCNRSIGFQRVAGGLLVLLLAGPAHSALIHEHVGDTDPLTEGFGLWPFNGGIATAAIPNDNGEAAWQIVNTTTVAQAAYIQLGGTGPYLGGSGLTQAQIDDIDANGFTLSARARVVAGPIYDAQGTQQVSAGIFVAGFSGFRFDIGLGSDGAGNTAVVAPQQISLVGSFFSHDPFQATIVVPGNDYHLYQLSYDPTTATATLYIDGVPVITGYPGAAVTGGVVANNVGLGFGSINLATVNFSLVRLESGQIKPVPAFGPSGLVALGVAVFGAGLVASGRSRAARRRSRHAASDMRV